jgi:hypothetical protein
MGNPLKSAAKKFTLNTGSIYARPANTNHRIGLFISPVSHFARVGASHD